MTNMRTSGPFFRKMRGSLIWSDHCIMIWMQKSDSGYLYPLFRKQQNFHLQKSDLDVFSSLSVFEFLCVLWLCVAHNWPFIFEKTASFVAPVTVMIPGGWVHVHWPLLNNASSRGLDYQVSVLERKERVCVCLLFFLLFMKYRVGASRPRRHIVNNSSSPCCSFFKNLQIRSTRRKLN